MPIRFLLPLCLAALLAGSAVSQEPAKPLQADPAADQFLVAQLAYQEAMETADPKLQKANFDAALLQFSRFLRFHPEHPDAVQAWYYSAVCYQKTNQQESARRCLNAVVEDGKTGPLVGSAAYQLATHHYDSKTYVTAEPLFALASTESDNVATRQLALYRRALCFQKLDKPKETIAILEQVLADPESPFHDRAESALAFYYKQNDRPDDALALFEKLATGKDPKTKADATLQAALIARDLGKSDLARTYFEKILVTPGLDQWKGEAQLSLISEASLAGNHARVLELDKLGRFKLSKDQEVRRILLLIRSHEALGQKEATVPLYQELERLSPGSKTGFEASYVLLTRQYGAGARDFAKQATEFLDRYAKDQANDGRTHNVRLMLAETLYKAEDYKAAAQTYAAIDLKHLDPENLVGVRYRLANALLESGQLKEALAAIEAFLAHHATDKRVPTLLAKRADANAAAGNREAALRDYESLIANNSDPALTEYAWAQKASLHKDADEFEAFLDCHRHLAADFPNRSAENKTASEFWTGWALFRLNKLEECIPHLEKARLADPKLLGRESTIHLALAHYSLQNLPALEAELDRLLADDSLDKVGRNVFGWVGVKIASEEEDYRRAWKYLPHAVDLAKPTETKTLVWRAYAKAAVENGEFPSAIPALAILLERDENDFLKAESHYLTARSLFGLNDLQKAHTAAEDALGLKPQGRLNADIRLLLGDIALGENDPSTAAKYYVVVAELYSDNDPSVAVAALRRAAAALEDLGTPAALADAKRYRERLKTLESPPSPPPGG
ncbi:MAG: tetratricopeptide repeat protein [Verrucomicrobia bacterium]|nr:tetratricopeptide repeat protein [Verrucomicrobiota bacterium]MDA1007136.1 tetratricopeptide repeat protein [Verrucomicrobiota bacterium]